MPTPTRYPSGVTTAAKDEPLGMFGMPDPTKWHVFFDDFDEFSAVLEDATTAARWTATDTNTTLATVLLVDGDGGILSVTNTAADNDAIFLQWRGNMAAAAAVHETFRFATGKRMFFKTRFQISDATQSDFVIGLQITDATPLDVTDGIFFIKADDAATVEFRVEKDNVASTVAAFTTLANATWVELAFAYDGRSTFTVYVDGVARGSITTTANAPDDEDLAVSFGLQNGAAAAKNALIDYIFVAKER